MSFVFEELAKDMNKPFALGCMGQSDVNAYGIRQFQLQTMKL